VREIIEENEKDADHQDGHHHHSKKEKLDFGPILIRFINSLVISQDNKIYKFEQVIITILCLGSSYYYMFLVVFGSGSQYK